MEIDINDLPAQLQECRRIIKSVRKTLETPEGAELTGQAELIMHELKERRVQARIK